MSVLPNIGFSAGNRAVQKCSGHFLPLQVGSLFLLSLIAKIWKVLMKGVVPSHYFLLRFFKRKVKSGSGSMGIPVAEINQFYYFAGNEVAD